MLVCVCVYVCRMSFSRKGIGHECSGNDEEEEWRKNAIAHAEVDGLALSASLLISLLTYRLSNVFTTLRKLW